MDVDEQIIVKYLLNHQDKCGMIPFYLIFFWFAVEKIYGPIEKNKDDLGNLGNNRKLIRHILSPLKPHNFSIKQFFITRTI